MWHNPIKELKLETLNYKEWFFSFSGPFILSGLNFEVHKNYTARTFI
jgi:hypothetical protein